MAADAVAPWKASGGPSASARSSSGLEELARSICRRAGVGEGFVGWTMVAIVSEFWREKLSQRSGSGRLLLLPDCPSAAKAAVSGDAGGVPRVCGPACDVATLWSAARDRGWTVLSTSSGLSAIGGLLTGQYGGVVGVASLPHLRKAFAMLPCFSLPIAAVPTASTCETRSGVVASGPHAGCRSGLDVETALGFLGVATGGGSPVADYLPLLREAAEMFTARGLADVFSRLGLGPETGSLLPPDEAQAADAVGDPLDAAATLSVDFLRMGGKFLRPFVALAAYDAVLADRNSEPKRAASFQPADREAAKAVAVAIEVFHKASLVHDDIEDDDAMRYGRPTMHSVHGVPSAVNAGDWLLGFGYRIIAAIHEVAGRDGPSSRLSADLLAILSDAHLRLARGQGAELWWRGSSDKRISVDKSLEIYGLKTSPAFEAAIAMGVRLAGWDPVEAGPLGRYAFHVGSGFQILNDLKDWNGDLENSRQAAGDLLGGRPTVLLALALSRLEPGDAEKLLGLTCGGGEPRGPSGPMADSERVAAAADLFRKADVFTAAAGIVAEQRRAALASIAACRLGRLREVLEFLLDLAVPDLAVPEQDQDPA